MKPQRTAADLSREDLELVVTQIQHTLWATGYTGDMFEDEDQDEDDLVTWDINKDVNGGDLVEQAAMMLTDLGLAPAAQEAQMPDNSEPAHEP